MRQNGATVDIHLIGDGHVVSKNGDILQTSPSADRAVPANDGGLDPGVVLDLAVLHHDAALQTDSITDHDVRANDHIGANTAVVADLGGGIDHNVAAVHIGLGHGGELLGVALGQGGEVQAGTSEEVLGLTDIHPEALEVKGMQLAVLADGGEGFLLNGGGAQLNAVQDTGVHDVDTSVNTVADELDGLLDEAVDARGVVGLVNDDTVLGGFVDLGDNNGTLLAVGLVESGKLLEWEITDNIGVENEERRVVLAQDLLRQLERASRAQRFRLDREFNVDTVLLLVLLESRDHDIGAVIDSQDDIGDTSGSQALDLVEDHGAVTELDERLRESERLEDMVSVPG